MASAFGNLKMVMLSDLHIGKTWPVAVSKALKIINKLKPDVIFLTGDYVVWGGKKAEYDKAISFLSRLKAPLGVYAVMGDADYQFSRKSCEFCHEKGSAYPAMRHQVKFLRNSQAVIKAGKKEIYIAGVDSHSQKDYTLKKINKLLNGSSSILLSHSAIPYNYIDPNKNVLVLSGDTHGGQIYLPGFIWKISKRKKDTMHMYGLYNDKNKFLYVTSGIGTSGMPIRLGVPPEVVLFEFAD